MKEVRVRIAPSPTGKLHIGTARTALFNYLFAKQRKGTFVLRIEDTDTERSKKEYEKSITDGFEWLGIELNEMPGKGNYGPYRQSERKDIYTKYLKKLLEEDKAYYCFCPKEKLEAEKEKQIKEGKTPCYTGECSSLTKEEINKYLEEGRSSTIRLRNQSKIIKFKDLIRGEIEFDTSLMGDFIIAKNLSEVLYNFACIVDDCEMKISHVIRGEDHITNTPRQMLLQEALGFYHPQYGHLPLILGSDKKKMSKRHGVTSILEYKLDGYLSEALVNFMAFLGWNPGTEEEIYSMKNLIKDFDIEKIQKSGAVFNIQKLESINSFYIKQKPINKLTEFCIFYLIQTGLIKPEFKEGQFPPAYGGKEIIHTFKVSQTKKDISFDMLSKMVSLYQKRLTKISEISELISFFFEDFEYEKGLLKWKEMTNEEIKASLDRSKEILLKIDKDKFNKKNLTEILLEKAKDFGEEIKKEGDRGYLLWPLRVALTGKENSAGPFEIMDILGKEETIKRINKALNK